jgi:DNA-binding ferritin-like protein
MPEHFVEELDQGVRPQMIEVLNSNLSNVIALALAVKPAHWNL